MRSTMNVTLAVVIAVLWAVAAPAANEAPKKTILLKNGNSLKGEVLRERAGSLIVDLGFTVVTVPNQVIAERIPEKAGDADPAVKASEEHIYHEATTGLLKEKAVKDLTGILGESVVLVSTPAGMGSGFVINEKGHVVTNFHVISNERKIKVTVFRKKDKILDRVKIEKVKIVAINPYLDLALLKLELPEDVKQLKWVHLGTSDAVRDGQNVFAIGNPLGLERTISEGIISTTRRSFDGQLFLQTTTPLNPGNSGGPLFNLRGEVLGVTNMKAGWFTEGLSFAIPVDTLKFFLRNRDVFAFDKDNPNTGHHYLAPPSKDKAKPKEEAEEKVKESKAEADKAEKPKAD